MSKDVNVRVSEPLASTSLSPTHLFSVASSKGLGAAVTTKGVVVFDLHALRKTFTRAERNASPSAPVLSTLTLPPDTGDANILTFAANESLLLVGTSHGSILIWEVSSLRTSPLTPRIMPPPNGLNTARIHMLAPNPGDKNALCVALLNVDPSSRQHGTAHIFDLCEAQWVCTLPASHVTSACWSTRGKQLVLGLQSGELLQLTPEGEVKATLPPLPESERSLYVEDVQWLENHAFLVTYNTCPPAAEHSQEPVHEYEVFMILRDPKANTMTYSAFPLDVAPPFGDTSRWPCRYACTLRDWMPMKHIIFMACSASTDVGVIGFKHAWEALELEETSRPVLPFSSQDETSDTAPVALALDLSSTDSVPDPNAAAKGEDPSATLPAVPILYVYTNDGVLLAYHVIFTEAEAPYPGMVSIESNPAFFPSALPAPTIPQPSSTPAPAFGSTFTPMPTFASTSTPAPTFGSTTAFGGTSSKPAIASAPAFGQTSSFGAASLGGGFSEFGAKGTSAFGTGFEQQSQHVSFGQKSGPSLNFASQQPAFGQTQKPVSGSISGFSQFSSKGSTSNFGTSAFSAASSKPNAFSNVPSTSNGSVFGSGGGFQTGKPAFSDAATQPKLRQQATEEQNEEARDQLFTFGGLSDALSQSEKPFGQASNLLPTNFSFGQRSSVQTDGSPPAGQPTPRNLKTDLKDTGSNKTASAISGIFQSSNNKAGSIVHEDRNVMDHASKATQSQDTPITEKPNLEQCAVPYISADETKLKDSKGEDSGLSAQESIENKTKPCFSSAQPSSGLKQAKVDMSTNSFIKEKLNDQGSEFPQLAENESKQAPSSFTEFTKGEPKESALSFGKPAEDKPKESAFSFAKPAEDKPKESAFSFAKPAEDKLKESAFSFAKPPEDKPKESVFSFGKPAEDKPKESAFSFAKPAEDKPKESTFSFSKPAEDKPKESAFSFAKPAEDKPKESAFSFGKPLTEKSIEASSISAKLSDHKTSSPNHSQIKQFQGSESVPQLEHNSKESQPVAIDQGHSKPSGVSLNESVPKIHLSQVQLPNIPYEQNELAREFVKVYTLLQEELNELARQTKQCTDFFSRLKQPSLHKNAMDLSQLDTWVFGDLGLLHGMSDELAQAVVLSQPQRSEAFKRILSIESVQLKSEVKREEVARFLRARQDSDFAKMVRVRHLGPEQMENQARLRRASHLVRERMNELGEYFDGLKKSKANEKYGRTMLRAPALDTIYRSVDHIDRLVSERIWELDQIEQYLRAYMPRSSSRAHTSYSPVRPLDDMTELDAILAEITYDEQSVPNAMTAEAMCSALWESRKVPVITRLSENGSASPFPYDTEPVTIRCSPINLSAKAPALYKQEQDEQYQSEVAPLPEPAAVNFLATSTPNGVQVGSDRQAKPLFSAFARSSRLPTLTTRNGSTASAEYTTFEGLVGPRPVTNTEPASLTLEEFVAQDKDENEDEYSDDDYDEDDEDEVDDWENDDDEADEDDTDENDD